MTMLKFPDFETCDQNGYCDFASYLKPSAPVFGIFETRDLTSGVTF